MFAVILACRMRNIAMYILVIKLCLMSGSGLRHNFMTCNVSVWCEQIIVMYLYIKEGNTAFHVLIVDGSLEYLV